MPSQDFAYVSISAAWGTTKTVSGFTTLKENDQITDKEPYSTSAGAANVTYYEERSLTASATQTYNLQSLTHPKTGESIVMTRLYALVLVVSAGQVEIGPGASNGLQFRFGAAGDTLVCTVGRYVIAPDANSTVDASNKTFDFVAGGSGATYKVAFIGGTA